MKSKELVAHRKQLHPIFAAPAFDGSQDLSEKTLLLHTEQGFGDSLQFARFINLVRPRVKKLVMWARPGLGRLFKYNFDIAEISENVFHLPAFDLQLSLLSIPYYFDRELKTLEASTPYLSAPPVKDRTLDKPHLGELKAPLWVRNGFISYWAAQTRTRRTGFFSGCAEILRLFSSKSGLGISSQVE